MNEQSTTLMGKNASDRWGPDQLCIRGGQLNDDRHSLQALLAAWRLPRAETALVLVEWVHKMQLLSRDEWEQHSDREKLDLLERLRIFGPGGDFELRRDEGRLFWRWIGEPDGREPKSEEHGGRDFWAGEDRPTFLRAEIEHLLWGKRDRATGAWVDDRVARTPLRYPIDTEAQRVAILGWQFIAEGTAQFVWWRELIEGRPA